MEKLKTLGYDWEFGHEELIMKVNAYRDRNRLYVGLYHEDDGICEGFGDLTVNLPAEELKPNEAFIDHHFANANLAFIKKYQLGEIMPVVVTSGYAKFVKVGFNLEQLAVYDPDGVQLYRELHSNEL